MNLSSNLAKDVAHGFLNRRIEAPEISNPKLIINSGETTMLRVLQQNIHRSESFCFSVAFISSRALALLKQTLLDFPGRGKIITSTYLDFNEPRMFRELNRLDNVDVCIYEDGHGAFHPKGYVFDQGSEVSAIVGSSNLTDSALLQNTEWNIRFSTSQNGDIAYQLQDAIRLQCEKAMPLTEEWIRQYEKRRTIAALAPQKQLEDGAPEDKPIVANSMQARALSQLEQLKITGENRALVISATGTGKTILSALAAKQFSPSRVLFIAHREQILRKAAEEFQRVFQAPAKDFGFFVGKDKVTEPRFIFSSIQSLSKTENLNKFSPTDFDFVIVDEVHRGIAKTYETVLDHFKPKFLLGLTATPERTDGKDIFRIFDYNVAYEIRLQEALEAKMLCPFHYYGVTDYITESGEVVEDTSELSKLISTERVEHILENLEKYGLPQDVRGLIFCSSKGEATELSELLNSSTLNGKGLHTTALLGDTEQSVRNAAIEQLETGELDYILTVDIFNEGIDIPSVNQIVMLRGTQSSIIFTQQLGRGLRKYRNKDHLRVIDFIGNYKNNFLIPIALFGDNSKSKDSIRKKMIENNEDNTIAGVSSVNFDHISRKKIFESLSKVSLDSVFELKKEVQQLEVRLNRLPKLFDFARFDTVDPLVMATKRQNYWQLLYQQKFVDVPPTPLESDYLKFLSNELLSGKQPQELVLLQHLLEHSSISRLGFQDLLKSKNMASSEDDISVVERVLTLSFYDSRFYSLEPIINPTGRGFTLGAEFEALYNSDSEDFPNSFRSHVDDLVETALFRSREKGFWEGMLKVGNRYTRKDACRLLKLETNQMSTLYGYKVDEYSGSVPIFITYHKGDSISAQVKYQDTFLDHGTLQWFTRNRTSLKGKSEAAIVNHKFPLHVFVQRNDTEGRGFFYLGEARATDPEETYIQSDDNKNLSTVRMKLVLDHPVTDGFLQYLEASET